MSERTMTDVEIELNKKLLNRLIDKVNAEFEKYEKRVLELPPKEILAEAWKYGVKDDFHYAFTEYLNESAEYFNADTLLDLLETDNILEALYNIWYGRDYEQCRMENMADIIYRFKKNN